MPPIPTSNLSPYKRHKMKWENCKRCLLHEGRQKVVFMRGTLPCDLLFIGEAPGASEDSLGRPFIGPAGHLLDKIIEQALIGEPNVTYAMTNLVGCIPIGEDGAKTAEPPLEAIAHCAPKLVELIDMADPSVIVCVGRLSMKHLPGVPEGTKVIGIIHPAAILRLDISQRDFMAQRCVTEIQNALVPF